MHGGFEFGEAVAEERGRSPREGEGVAGEFVDGPCAIPWMTPRLDVAKGGASEDALVVVDWVVVGPAARAAAWPEELRDDFADSVFGMAEFIGGRA